MEQSEKTLDMIVNLCKNRGYVFPGSEIYGGLANSWDYGPLGVEFKNNVKKAWLKKFVQESPYNVGLDAAIIMNPQTWVTTGHVSSFSDPLLDCRACKARHRADKLIGEEHPEVNVDAMSFDEMDAFIAEHEDIVCPVCGKHDFTPIRKFNLMFKTAIGVTEDSSSTCYLRPETAQGIFVNFANIQRTTRRKLPFGVCQVGKAFRNEITPGNFTFRTREFEQMECEFFCKPGTDLDWFAYWKDYCENWLLSLGIKKEHLRLRDHEPAELAFYSRATTDIEYAFPFTDWGELWGIADRTNYDLITTTPVPSASVTAVRTRSALGTASPWTSTPSATRPRASWQTHCVCRPRPRHHGAGCDAHLRSSRATSRARSSSKVVPPFFRGASVWLRIGGEVRYTNKQTFLPQEDLFVENFNELLKKIRRFHRPGGREPPAGPDFDHPLPAGGRPAGATVRAQRL